MRRIIVTLLAIGAHACFDRARAEVLSPTRTYEVAKPFTDDGGHVAMDISGVACMPANAAPSSCLVIDDQRRFAQAARLESGRIAAGARLRLEPTLNLWMLRDSGIGDQDGLDEQVPFRDWQNLGMV